MFLCGSYMSVCFCSSHSRLPEAPTETKGVTLLPNTQTGEHLFTADFLRMRQVYGKPQALLWGLLLTPVAG